MGLNVMMCHFFRPFRKLFLFAFYVFGILGCGLAQAQTPPSQVAPGCNPAVWTALQAKAQAQVAYDSAVTRELINKPDSVLTLTCFDQAAAISAANGGAVFAGDFTSQLKTIMPVAPLPATGSQYNCTGMGDLWNEIVNQGVDPGIPYATFDDLMSGNLPGVPAPNTVGTDFKAGWDAANNAKIFSNLNTAMGALLPPAAVDFSGAKGTCDVLMAAQIITGPCN